MTSPEAAPRTAAEVTRDWLSGAMLVGMGSVEQGQYEGQARYQAAADEAIRWLADSGMRLAIEAEAAAGTALDVERLRNAMILHHIESGANAVLLPPFGHICDGSCAERVYARLAGVEGEEPHPKRPAPRAPGPGY
jgi:hypothetical protein